MVIIPNCLSVISSVSTRSPFRKHICTSACISFAFCKLGQCRLSDFENADAEKPLASRRLREAVESLSVRTNTHQMWYSLVFLSIVFVLFTLRVVGYLLPFDATNIRQMFHTAKFLVKTITRTYI
nr:MAG TPA: Intrinsic membrane protein pufX protein, quinone exchange, photosynthesis [Caudoviricetes sp.]